MSKWNHDDCPDRNEIYFAKSGGVVGERDSEKSALSKLIIAKKA